MENEQEKKKIDIKLILLIIFVIVFLVSAVILVINLIPPKNKEAKEYKKQVSSTALQEELPDNPIDFTLLTNQNSDVCGWITVDGTSVDYPILMSGIEKEEDYYIDHDIDCNTKKAGSIYIQRINSNDFSDFNTVVYGHNMANGSMFGTLKKFRNKNFFNENRNIYVYTPGHILKYEIISAFIHDDRHILHYYDSITEEGRQSFIDLLKNPNTIVKNVLDNIEVSTTDDKLITLSTCTTRTAATERYLVVGKLISDTKTK